MAYLATVNEMAERLGISPKNVRKHAARGTFGQAVRRIDGVWRFDVEEGVRQFDRNRDLSTANSETLEREATRHRRSEASRNAQSKALSPDELLRLEVVFEGPGGALDVPLIDYALLRADVDLDDRLAGVLTSILRVKGVLPPIGPIREFHEVTNEELS